MAEFINILQEYSVKVTSDHVCLINSVSSHFWPFLMWSPAVMHHSCMVTLHVFSLHFIFSFAHHCCAGSLIRVCALLDVLQSVRGEMTCDNHDRILRIKLIPTSLWVHPWRSLGKAISTYSTWSCAIYQVQVACNGLQLALPIAFTVHSLSWIKLSHHIVHPSRSLLSSCFFLFVFLLNIIFVIVLCPLIWLKYEYYNSLVLMFFTISLSVAVDLALFN